MIPCWAGLLVLAFGATRLGIPVKSLSLNMGPGFPLGRLFGIPVRLGVIPGGNLDMDDERAAETSAARRIGLTTLIPIVHLAVGVAILGWDRGWSHFTEGFGQLVNGLLHPRTVGVGLLQAFDQVRLKSVTDAVGVLGAKQAALALLPIGGTWVTQFLRQLFYSNKIRAVELGLVLLALIGLLICGTWGLLTCLYAFGWR
jgi:hypothetical protein